MSDDTNPTHGPTHKACGDTFVDDLEAAYKLVSYWPEQRGGKGFMDLLVLRNMVPEAVRRLRSKE